MRIYKLWDDLQTSLWFRATLWVFALGLLAWLLTEVDSRVGQLALLRGRPWFLIGGAEGARTMLGSISAAMLTVTTLTFSIMMLAVVQTANAYSPRILREFLGDTSNQHVLGILIGTFLFSLLVLRRVRSSGDDIFVPALATNVAMFLSLLSTAAFIYFINHVAQSIKVSNIVRLILASVEPLIDDIFPGSLGVPCPAPGPTLPDQPAATLYAAESGYVQLFEPQDLLAIAVQSNVLLRLEHAVGEYVLTGAPIVTVWPATALTEHLKRAIQQAVVLGRERTLVQDVLFGVRHLADIALRAISPAINDPTTTLDCINALATLLARLIQREPVSPYRCDANGTLRVIARKATFDQVLDEAFSQIYQYGAHDVFILARLIEVCGELGHVTKDPAERAALWRFVQRIVNTADQRITTAYERRQVNLRLGQAAEMLAQDARPFLLNGAQGENGQRPPRQATIEGNRDS